MGLKNNMKYKGMNINGAYVAIKHFSGNKDNMGFNAQVYADKQTADADESSYLYITQMFYFKPNINKNLWKQAYKVLKKQFDFKDAEDVLDEDVVEEEEVNLNPDGIGL